MSSKTHARDLALQAFAMMSECGVTPEPRAYEIFYTYAAGRDELLIRAVDEAKASPEGLTDAALDEIHRGHLAHIGPAVEIERTGADVGALLGNLNGALASSIAQGNLHAKALDSARSKLESQTATREELRKVHAILVATADGMRSSNAALQKEAEKDRLKIADLQAQIESASKESLQDALTGVFNRRYFDDALARALKDHGSRLSLIMADIDHFKSFNDSHGHQVGDQVLRLVASCLSEGVRPEDVVARYGGEEFGVVLCNIDHKEAVEVAERIRQTIASKELVQRSSRRALGRVSMSLGVVTAVNGDTPSSIVDRADRLLYAAKNAGRNRVLSEETHMIRERPDVVSVVPAV